MSLNINEYLLGNLRFYLNSISQKWTPINSGGSAKAQGHSQKSDWKVIKYLFVLSKELKSLNSID